MGILDSFTDRFKGGEFSCHPKMLVKNFRAAIKEELGIDVSVYIKNSNSKAKDDVTLASTKPDDFKGMGEDVKMKLSEKVGDVEKKFKEKMGVKIQILDKDGKLADNDLTLGELRRS
ncbi:MAG: hypothetical protein IPQ05_23265 [Leptospiraceae bacterium]|nr:hypothetical protein [Leptospiraceae bacterium]